MRESSPYLADWHGERVESKIPLINIVKPLHDKSHGPYRLLICRVYGTSRALEWVVPKHRSDPENIPNTEPYHPTRATVYVT